MMAEVGVNIELIYSDHQNQLILVVDDFEKGPAVSEIWNSGAKSRVSTEFFLERA
jgi:hypothetical protein